MTIRRTDSDKVEQYTHMLMEAAAAEGRSARDLQQLRHALKFSPEMLETIARMDNANEDYLLDQVYREFKERMDNGDLTISVGKVYDGKTIMLCESEDFEDGVTVKLNGGSVANVTNITKDWLPKGLDTEKDGQHNGENYLAYTFYLKNTGDKDLEYNTKMEVTGASKSSDEAVRFQIYRNGEDQVFAKGQYDDRSKPEEDATAFVDDKTVYTAQATPLKAGEVDKYTVVIWIEGNDPQCVDDIRCGSVRSHMVFDVVPDVK